MIDRRGKLPSKPDNKISKIKSPFVPQDNPIIIGDSVQIAFEKTQGQINNLAKSQVSLGNWNALTNTPILPLTPANPTYKSGEYYNVLVSGIFNGVQYTVGDKIVVSTNKATNTLFWELNNFDNETKQDKIFTYTVANLTALYAITGMIAGNTAKTLDTLKEYIYTTQWEEVFETLANKNQPNGYAGLDSDNSVLATQLEKPILNFFPRSFYSFEIAGAVATFHNATNIIKKNELLLCTESDGSLPFNKGTLYQIDTETATPTTAMLNSHLTPSQMVGKTLTLHRDFNNYPKGTYTANDTETDLINYANLKVDKINITVQSNIGSASKTPTITINTQGQITMLTEQDIAIASNQVSQATITPTSGNYADGDTQEQINNKGQGQINETVARIVTVENRPVGNSGEGKRYFISTPPTAGIYSATEIFTQNPATITETFTTAYKTVFEAETEALNITAIPSGNWNTDISFTHTNDKDFTAKISFYDNTTLLGEIESLILAGNEKIVLSKTFPTFAFTSGNKLKFKFEAKSDHSGAISVFTNDGTNDLHIHTPVLIDVVNSAVQTALNLKADQSTTYTKIETDTALDLKQNNIISVANQAAMLALSTAIVGDIVIRTDDNNYQYRLNALPASNLSNWEVLGKDAQPVGETVEDIVTTNEVITSKVNGLYAFTGTPNGGFPVGVAQGDIAQKTGNVWTVVYTFINAPATIFSNFDGKVYLKTINGAGIKTWQAKSEPSVYEVGPDKQYTTLQSAIDAYQSDFTAAIIANKSLVGVIFIYQTLLNEHAIIGDTTDIQNLQIEGYGCPARSNTQISKITIGAFAHRITLKNIMPSNTTANAPLVIQSTGTCTENGVINTPRGKHVFDGLVLSTTHTTSLDITACDNFLNFNNCDFGGKIVSIANKTGIATSITINGCANGILNVGNNRIVSKNNSASVYRGTISTIGTVILDVDTATPIAYSILRTYSALGASVPIALGSMIVNDDVGGTLQMLKCTTAYNIAGAVGVGTAIDLTKYQIQTDNSKENAFTKNTAFNKNYSTTPNDIKPNGTQNLGTLDTLPRVDHIHPTDTSREAVANKVSTFTATPNDINYITEKLAKDSLDLKQDKIYHYTDTEANILLINPTINNGKTAKATDTLKEYISNGTAWIEISGGNSLTVGAVQTANFTAIANTINPVNTTAGVVIATLPSSPIAGDIVRFTDYANKFATNKLTLNPNGLKINSSTSNVDITTNNSDPTLTYIDATEGWALQVVASGGGGFSVTADTTTTTLDLNNLTTTGITNFSGVTSLINGPTGIVPIAGKLLAVGNYFSTNGREQNLLLNDNKSFRSYINNIWSSWQLIATVDTTPNSDIIDALATPPASPSNGDAYVMLASPTGAWSTFAQGTVTTYNESTASWVNTIPANGTAITFSNPVNLNSINSYYIAGQTYKYNSAWGSPVIAGLLWQLFVPSSQFQPYNSQSVALSLVSNVVTATCSQNHNLAVGYSVVISASPNTAFNETVTVTAIVSPTVFKYAKTLANATTTGTLKATTQLLPSGCTSALIPSTISFNIIIAVSSGSYGTGSFICKNDRSTPCYIAGIPVGKLESISLITNATPQWETVDKKYTVENIPNHSFTNALHQNKIIVNTGDNEYSWTLADGSDLKKVKDGKFLLNVIDANRVLVANGGNTITTFVPHNLAGDKAYSYGNWYNGGAGNLVDGGTLTVGYRATSNLLSYKNEYQIEWTPTNIFFPVIASTPVALQVEAYNKQFALIDGEKLNNVNNILSLTTSNTKIKISAKTKSVRGKFSGQTVPIRSVDEDFNAALIPVFGLYGLANSTNCNPNLDPAIKNINSYGNGGSTINFILAINPAGTFFAIPAPTATPNSHFVDAIGNSAVMTAGQIGFELNPLKGYRNNGTAVELYDFILMGQVTWNGSVFSNVLNISFNGVHDTGWFAQGANTVSTKNHNIGSKRIKSYILASTTGTDAGIEGPAQNYYGNPSPSGSDIGVITNNTYQYKTNNTGQVIWGGGTGGTDFVSAGFARIYTERIY